MVAGKHRLTRVSALRILGVPIIIVDLGPSGQDLNKGDDRFGRRPIDLHIKLNILVPRAA